MKLNEKENIVARFEDGFKQMWVNNGNALSKLYAGTGALSQGGSKLMDGARSAARTIQNNLLDKDKQSAYDLLLHGTVRKTDLADRARLLLPMEYWNGEHSTLSHFTLYIISHASSGASVPVCFKEIRRFHLFRTFESCSW